MPNQKPHFVSYPSVKNTFKYSMTYKRKTGSQCGTLQTVEKPVVRKKGNPVRTSGLALGYTVNDPLKMVNTHGNSLF